MSYQDVEERSKLHPFVCKEDAKRRDAKNIGRYTLEQIKQARQLEEDVRSAYFRSRVFVNYRERFIAVKVEAPQFADKVSLAVRELDEACEENGIQRAQLAKGTIVYRIPQS